MLRRIFRIEDAKGTGPFGNGHARRHDGASEPPGPYNDLEAGTALAEAFRSPGYQRFYFGFASKQQLERWFYDREGRAAMKEAGSRLVVYEVPDESVVDGNWQIAFIKDVAKPVDIVDLETLEDVREAA